jgi:hypothetical protein
LNTYICAECLVSFHLVLSKLQKDMSTLTFDSTSRDFQVILSMVIFSLLFPKKYFCHFQGLIYTSGSNFGMQYDSSFWACIMATLVYLLEKLGGLVITGMHKEWRWMCDTSTLIKVIWPHIVVSALVVVLLSKCSVLEIFVQTRM